jgi:hypothetical protein
LVDHRQLEAIEYRLNLAASRNVEVPGMHTTVQLGFTLTATTTAVKALVFEFPEKFRQVLLRKNSGSEKQTSTK